MARFIADNLVKDSDREAGDRGAGMWERMYLPGSDLVPSPVPVPILLHWSATGRKEYCEKIVYTSYPFSAGIVFEMDITMPFTAWHQFALPSFTTRMISRYDTFKVDSDHM